MKKYYFLISLFLLLPLMLLAQHADEILQNKLSSFQSMTADFQQIVKNQEGMVLQKSFGKMAIQRPGKFRWETLKPLEQIIVTDGKSVWLYEPDLEQVSIRTLNKNVGQTPVLLLTSSNALVQDNFVVSHLRLKQSGECFQLIPKNKQETFNSILLCFQNDKIARMNLSNKLGQETIIVFKNVKTFLKLNKNLFYLAIPKNVDVIDQRKN